MSSSNYKSTKMQIDKVQILEQKVQLLTQQLEEQTHINENYEIYKEQLYSQMEKYVEIIDYTMKLLYKLNEFMKNKCDEANTYSTAQIDKVTSEEKSLIQKLNGLYTLNEPSLDSLKGVEEYQIIGEDTQATIIGKIQGVAKVVVDNVKILGQNCIQHEKLKFYVAEKIESINSLQEKLQQEHKYTTLQLQKEIQQNSIQPKEQNILAQVTSNLQQQQSNDQLKNGDMWVDIVSKLVEYCTTLQINQMQIQNQLNSAVQKLFKSKKEYQMISNSNNKLKRDQYIKDDILSEQYSESKTQKDNEEDEEQEEQQLKERVPAGRGSRSPNPLMNIFQDNIENLEKLDTVIKSVQKKEPISLSPNQKIRAQSSLVNNSSEGIKIVSSKQLSKSFIRFCQIFLVQINFYILTGQQQIQNQLNQAVQNLFKQKLDIQEVKQNNDSFTDLDQQYTSENEKKQQLLSQDKHIVKQEDQQSERVPAGRLSKSPTTQQYYTGQDSDRDMTYDQLQQQQYASIIKSSQKKDLQNITSNQVIRTEQFQEKKQYSTLKDHSSILKKEDNKDITEIKEIKQQIVQSKQVEEFQQQERVPAGRGLRSINQSQVMSLQEDKDKFEIEQQLKQESSQQNKIQNIQSNQSFRTQASQEKNKYSTLNNEVQNFCQIEQALENSQALQNEPKTQIRQIIMSSAKSDHNQPNISSQKKRGGGEDFQYQYQTNKSYATEKQNQSLQQQFSKRSLGFPEAINKISISDQILLEVENQTNAKQLSNSYISPNFSMAERSKLQASASEKPALGFQSISQINKFCSQNNNNNSINNSNFENNNSVQTNNNLVSDSSRQQLQTSDSNRNKDPKYDSLNFFGDKFNFEDKVIGNPPQLSVLHNKLERITTMQFPQRNSNSSNSQQDQQSIYSSRQQDIPQQIRPSKSRERIFSTNQSQASNRRSITTNRSFSNFGEFPQMDNNFIPPSSNNISYVDQRKANTNNTNLYVNSSQEWQFSVQQQQNNQQNNHQQSLSRISKTEMSWNSFENLQIPLRQSLQQQQQQPSLRNLMNVVNQQRINSSRSISNTNRQNTSSVEQPSQLYHDLIKQQKQIMEQSNNLSQNQLDQSQLNRSRLSQGQRRKIFEQNDTYRSQEGNRLSNENSRRQLSQYQTANLGQPSNDRSFYSSNNNIDSSRAPSNFQSNSNNSKPPQYQLGNRGAALQSGVTSQRSDKNPFNQGLLNDQDIRETFKVQLDTNYNSFQNKENFGQIIPKSNDRYLSQGLNHNKSNHNNSSQERMSQNSLKSKEPLSENSQNISMVSNKSQKQFYSISELNKISQQNRDKKKITNQYNM